MGLAGNRRPGVRIPGEEAPADGRPLAYFAEVGVATQNPGGYALGMAQKIDVDVAKMRAAFGAGNVRLARALARELEGSGSEEAARLREATEVDRRAFAIGGAALALGLLYLFAFILLR